MLNQLALNTLVMSILMDCAEIDPPLLASELTQHVFDAIAEGIPGQVGISIQQLLAAGTIAEVFDYKGDRQIRYVANPKF